MNWTASDRILTTPAVASDYNTELNVRCVNDVLVYNVVVVQAQRIRACFPRRRLSSVGRSDLCTDGRQGLDRAGCPMPANRQRARPAVASRLTHRVNAAASWYLRGRL